MITQPSNDEHKGTGTFAPVGMPRSSLMDSMSNQEFVTRIMAQGIALAFTLAQIAGAILFTPMVLAAYSNAGVSADQLPVIVSVVTWLNWYGSVLVILVGNALIFWAFYAVSKRGWIGIAFLPSLIYTFLTIFMGFALVAPLLGVF